MSILSDNPPSKVRKYLLNCTGDGSRQFPPTVGNGSSVGMVLIPEDLDLHQYCCWKYEANWGCFVMQVSGFLVVQMGIECELKLWAFTAMDVEMLA
jgi:hypothetical protein